MIYATKYVKAKNASRGPVKTTYLIACELCGTTIESNNKNRRFCNSSHAQKFVQNQPSTIEKKRKSQTIASAKPEVKERQKKAAQETSAKPETKANRSAAQLIAQNRPETLSKKRVTLQITNSRPETVERRKAAAREVAARPGQREKNSEAQLIAQNRPDVVEKRKITNADPEVKRKRKEKAKIVHNLPEVRQHHVIAGRLVNAKPDVIERKKIGQNRPGVSQKKHETRKRNGSYGKSKGEDALYEFLCKKFGVDDVERQASVWKWSIDFYVKRIDTYVQYDGRFYHWIGKPIEELETLAREKGKVYTVILRTTKRDIEQNEWFVENHKNLIRIVEGQLFEKYFEGEVIDV